MIFGVQQDALVNGLVIPFRPCQNLFQPVQMLQACQRRLQPKPQCANPGADTRFDQIARIHRPGIGTHNAVGVNRKTRSIPPSRGPPGNDDLDHAVLLPRAYRLHFPEQDSLGCYGQTEPFTTGGQSIHVRLPEPRLPMQNRHGFEQAISILKPAVSRQDPIRNSSPRGHDSAPPSWQCPVDLLRPSRSGRAEEPSREPRRR